MSGELLRVTDLKVAYHTPAGPFVAVKGANFEVRPGEIVGVVGESGSGKSTLASAVMGLLGSNASISGGTPIPRKERPASSVMTLGTSIAASTITGATTFGKICPKRMRRWPAPRPRWACT